MVTSSLATLFERDLNKLKEEIELTSSDKLWKTKAGVTNSCGNLALHICGNLNHFIGAILGHTGYEREREREFSDKFQSIEDIVEIIDQTKSVVTEVFASLTDEKLQYLYPVRIWDQQFTTEFFMLHLHSHLTYHLGQVNYLRRMLFSK